MRHAQAVPAILAGLALLIAVGSAGADERRFYLVKPFALSEQAPARVEPRDNVSTGVRAGGSEVLGEFASSPLAGGGFDAATGSVTLFLATGQQGMVACAEVAVTVSRNGPSGRQVVGSGAVATSILPRRDTTAPVVVPVELNGEVATSGQQVALEIVIGNSCDGGRNVTLLYDSLAAASRIDFSGEPTSPPPPPPGGSTTTTTVPTTSTLPPAVECAEFEHGTFGAVECWLGILTRVTGNAGTDALGGKRRARRIGRRVARISKPLDKAKSGRRVAKRLGAVGRRLTTLQRKVDRLTAKGRIDGTVGGEISAVAGGTLAELELLRAATR